MFKKKDPIKVIELPFSLQINEIYIMSLQNKANLKFVIIRGNNSHSSKVYEATFHSGSKDI